MYELKKIGKIFTSKFVGTGPSSYKKRIYRAAVSQKLRNTGLHYQQGLIAGTPTFISTSLLKFVPRYILTTLCVLPCHSFSIKHSIAVGWLTLNDGCREPQASLFWPIKRKPFRFTARFCFCWFALNSNACGCTSASTQLKERLLPFILFLQPVTKLLFCCHFISKM